MVIKKEEIIISPDIVEQQANKKQLKKRELVVNIPLNC